MPLVSVPYRFSVRLPAPVDAAYRWATDYRPDDPTLGGGSGTRTIVTLAPDALLLTDTVPSGRGTRSKTRLVRLLPGRHAWTSTHVSGPNRHSQFLYQLRPAGRGGSRLEFTGLHLARMRRRPNASAIAALGRAIARDDRREWLVYARVMARDLGGGPVRRARRGSR